MKKTIVLLIMLMCTVITVKAQSNYGAYTVSPYNWIRIYDDISKEWSTATKNEAVTFLRLSDDGNTFKITNTTYDESFIMGLKITRDDGNLSLHLGNSHDLTNVSITFFSKEHLISLTYLYAQKWYNIQYYCTKSGLDS
jgi:hypothetical protein